MPCEVAYRVRVPYAKARFRKLVNPALRTLRYNPKITNVSLAFLGDREMRALNRRYRKQRRTTDVLSFPGSGHPAPRTIRYGTPLTTGQVELGEVLVSVPQAKRQAKRYGHPLADELDMLVLHGLLHLAGYDHHRPADRRKMETMEQRVFKKRSLVRRSHS